MGKQQYHHITAIWSGEYTNLQLWQTGDLRFTVKLGEAGNFVAQPGSCPAHPRRQMKAGSVNGGRRRELTGRERQLYSIEKDSGVSPTGTVEQSSEDQALVNKQGSLQALSQETHRPLLNDSLLSVQWIFDIHCNDCLCGASGEYYHSLSQTYDWGWMFLCGLHPGYVRKDVSYCAELASIGTGISFNIYRAKSFEYLRATTLRKLYIYSWWGSLYFFCTFPLWGTHWEGKLK